MRGISSWPRHLGVVVFYVLTAVAVYANGLGGGFMFDDRAIFDSHMRDIHQLASQFFPAPVADGRMEAGRVNFIYRPLNNIFVMAVYHLFQGSPRAFHVVNLIVLAGAALAVYALILLLFEDWRLALATGALFLVHPVNSVIVDYVTAGVFGLQAIAMILAFIFFRRANLAAGAGCLAAALLIHETSALFIFYFLVLAYCEQGKNLFEGRGRLWLTVFAITALYALARWVEGSLAGVSVNNFPLFLMNGWEFTASLGKLMAWYVSQLVCPKNIVLLWTTPVVWAWPRFLALTTVAVIAAAAGLVLNRHFCPKPVAVGVGWLLCGFILLPAASLMQPVNGLMIEPHWFVFASLGFFLCAAFFLTRCALSLSARHFYVLLAVVMALWASVTVRVNWMWQEEKRYGRYWADQAPDFLPVYYHMGKVHFLDGEYEQARGYFRHALRHSYRVKDVLGYWGQMEAKSVPGAASGRRASEVLP